MISDGEDTDRRALFVKAAREMCADECKVINEEPTKVDRKKYGNYSDVAEPSVLKKIHC